ncbi:MAG: hypothetical protein HY433_01830 [Candidatus Liptonbacteria bacterium]|nr:hypothetical protein [Candidatus Liptonbacteria bacterium]
MAKSEAGKKYAQKNYSSTHSSIRVQVNRQSDPPITLEEKLDVVRFYSYVVDGEPEPVSQGKPVIEVPAELARYFNY